MVFHCWLIAMILTTRRVIYGFSAILNIFKKKKTTTPKIGKNKFQKLVMY